MPGWELAERRLKAAWPGYQRKYAGVMSRSGRHRRDSCQRRRHARRRPIGLIRENVTFSLIALAHGNSAPPRPGRGDVTLGRAVDAYLATLGGAEQASTRRVYGRILRRVAASSAAAPRRTRSAPRRFAAWFGQQWGDRRPATWNVALDAVRSAAAYWQRQGWIAADPSRMLRRRKPRPDRPGRCPAPRSSSCSPARTSACASGRCGGCCTRPRPGRPRCCARRRGPGPAQPARQGPPQGRRGRRRSSGRREPPGCCRGC